MTLTEMYASNFPQVPQEQIHQFLNLIAPVQNLTIKEKLNGPFCYFSTSKPNSFLKANGKKLNGQKILFTYPRRKEYNPERARLDQSSEMVPPPPKVVPYYIDTLQALIDAEPINDQYNTEDAAKIEPVLFKDIPRRFFEPTEFKAVEKKKKKFVLGVF
ncbi:RNA_recognition motif-containing protein [Hexamita inflata]|uniref:RNA recognition motif-containing protein n=1 Tax=Hexamita inflata TaxID=28002 RepID=A0AA86R3M4_9EUKA|nr:RNA recognition motif-containing protein [Hexamita inflata]